MRAPRGLIIVVSADEAVLRLPTPIFSPLPMRVIPVTSAAMVSIFKDAVNIESTATSPRVKEELVPSFSSTVRV